MTISSPNLKWLGLYFCRERVSSQKVGAILPNPKALGFFIPKAFLVFSTDGCILAWSFKTDSIYNPRR
jgi:hypothetical protein